MLFRSLEVDLLVIKKEPDVQITNEIGKLFRGHNIVEYKSPRDHLNIDTFYKAAAYACLYKAYGKTVDERKADDITVSLIREEKPEGTLSYFKEHGIAYINPYRGIYYVTDTVLFPTQIIVIKELNEEAHIWLKALSREMQKEQMRRLLEKIEKMKTKFDRELADSVLQVSVSANRQVVDELRGPEEEPIRCCGSMECIEPESRPSDGRRVLELRCLESSERLPDAEVALIQGKFLGEAAMRPFQLIGELR